MERFEEKLRDFPANIPRAATELAKQWRTDKALRQLEALLTVADARHLLLVSGTGDVIQPTDGIVGIGSGGNYAIAAARAQRTYDTVVLRVLGASRRQVLLLALAEYGALALVLAGELSSRQPSCENFVQRARDRVKFIRKPPFCPIRRRNSSSTPLLNR